MSGEDAASASKRDDRQNSESSSRPAGGQAAVSSVPASLLQVARSARRALSRALHTRFVEHHTMSGGDIDPTAINSPKFRLIAVQCVRPGLALARALGRIARPPRAWCYPDPSSSVLAEQFADRTIPRFALARSRSSSR